MTAYCNYLITNEVNGKVYVGYTKNLTKRWERHVKLAKGTGRFRLNLAMAKHGVENFTIRVIEDNMNTKAEACDRERFWIARYESFVDPTKGYNMTPGGEGGPTFLGRHHSKETKRKMSEIQRNRSSEWQANFKRAHQNRSEEWHANMCKAQQNRPTISEVARQRLREAWVKRKAEGRVITKEGRQKIAEAHRGKQCPSQTKEGVSDARKLSLLLQDVEVLEGHRTLSSRAQKRHESRIESGYWFSYQFKHRVDEQKVEDLRQRLRCTKPNPLRCALDHPPDRLGDMFGISI